MSGALPAPPGAASFAPLGRLMLIGCGNMGGAMLARWIAAGLPASDVVVVDPGNPSLPEGVAGVSSIADAGACDSVVLAIKPQQFGDLVASDALKAVGAVRAVSILAGVPLATLREGAGIAWVRAMPNLPVAIGQGVVALHGEGISSDDRDAVAALMAPLGLVEWIAKEASFDAVTALSGCGPGFVFRFVDALAAAGAALGLPADQSLRLATATVAGAAAMAAASDETPARLADRVASPGGSTREGLNVLDDGQALQSLLVATLAASARRNAELANVAR